MKQLKRITLKSGSRILDAQEMKKVIGGQVIWEACHVVSGSGVLHPDGTYTEDIVCGGECPTETVTGNTPKEICAKVSLPAPVGKIPILGCDCVPV